MESYVFAFDDPEPLDCLAPFNNVRSGRQCTHYQRFDRVARSASVVAGKCYINRSSGNSGTYVELHSRNFCRNFCEGYLWTAQLIRLLILRPPYTVVKGGTFVHVRPQKGKKHRGSWECPTIVICWATWADISAVFKLNVVS